METIKAKLTLIPVTQDSVQQSNYYSLEGVLYVCSRVGDGSGTFKTVEKGEPQTIYYNALREIVAETDSRETYPICSDSLMAKPFKYGRKVEIKVLPTNQAEIIREIHE